MLGDVEADFVVWELVQSLLLGTPVELGLPVFDEAFDIGPVIVSEATFTSLTLNYCGEP